MPFAVWTEYLRDYLGNATLKSHENTNITTPLPSVVTHLNYAFGGATTNNSIHPTGAPDTGQQIQMYSNQRTASAKALVSAGSLIVLSEY